MSYNTRINAMQINDYVASLKIRSKESRAYKKFQLIGLEIAEILSDNSHKTLYIKLAKERGSQELLELAKSVAERKNVKNKGAYFMKLLPPKIQTNTKKKSKK